MENSDKKKESLEKQNTLLQNTLSKKTLLATFNAHYGAMLTKKKLGSSCALFPVPRFLSSSCGICAVIENFCLKELINIAGEYLEAVYSVCADCTENLNNIENSNNTERKKHYGQEDPEKQNKQKKQKKYSVGDTVLDSQILLCKNTDSYIKIYDSEDTM